MRNLVRSLVFGASAMVVVMIAACDSGSDGSSSGTFTIDGSTGAFDSGGSSGSSGGDGSVSTPAPDFVWYVLDETSGTTAHDSSSNHSDITNLVGVTWSSGAVFDGQNSGGSVVVGPGYRRPPVTITAWLTPAARADQTSAAGALLPYPTNAVGDDIPAQFGFGLGLNVWTDGTPGSVLSAELVDTCVTIGGICAANSATKKCNSTTDCNQGFAAGTEYFVSVAIAPASSGATTTAANVYVNGTLWDSSTAQVPSAPDTVTLYLGRHNDDATYGTKRMFDGKIRDVRVYQRELAAPEIAQLYANGPTLHAP